MNTKERIVVDLNAIMETYASKQHNVILLNDEPNTPNPTPFEYVILVLMTVFNKDEMTAEANTMEAHICGNCIIGTYDYDEAEKLVNQAYALNEATGFNLRFDIKSI